MAPNWTRRIDGAEIAEMHTRIVLPEGAHWHARYLDARADRALPTVRARFLDGRRVLATEYLAAQDRRVLFRRMIDEALNGRMRLVLPALPPGRPWPAPGRDVGGEPLDIRVAMLKHTQLFNLTGHPAISIPVPAAGLPVGLQIVGRIGRTEELLSVAAAAKLE